ncbi:glycosyltransferase [Nonomuraea terrae]|nr:glycosyltransferase [Nonomuraea terrae]
MGRVALITNGSYGDVAPYAGLGQQLRTAGHAVRLAALSTYESPAVDAEIDFTPLPSEDHSTLLESERAQRANKGGAVGAAALLGLGVEAMRAQLPVMVEAAADADVVACSMSTLLLAGPIAEARGVPLLVLPLQPATPTREHGPLPLGGRDLGPWMNRVSAEVFGRFATRMFAPLVADLRDSLGLPPAGSPRRRAGYAIEELPVLYGFSPAVVPRPTDWPKAVDIAGYWWPPTPGRSWDPPAELVEFLADGPPPVFLGFGSMRHVPVPVIAKVVTEMIVRTGHRVIVQRGWARIDVDSPNALVIDHVPHSWLFPQVAAVVHHAGAGTTAAGLRAGVPAVPVPVAHDQPFWARRLVTLGAAPTIIPLRRLSGPRLADAIVRAVGTPAHRRRATAIADRLRNEDGAAHVEAAVRQLTAATA